MSKKKQRTGPSKLQRRARTYSFSPGRQDNIRVERSPHGPGPSGPRGRSGHASDEDADGLGTWNRTPTLHHKRSSTQPNRRKSSKRRREDHDREAEIKAMSSFMPVRPAAEGWTAGRPMKKDSKRIKTMSFGRHMDNPVSDISLPLPGSIHSSLSSDSEFGSFKVSALDALAPRPTLRYAHGSRWTPSRISAQTRSASQKRRLADREPIPEESLKSNQRIDELADNLDASDLRELMERDNRRRERKKQKEQDRMERRLARRAEKQRADEAESKKSGTPPPENHERGVLGRELVGLGIDPPSAVRTNSEEQASETQESLPDAEDTSSKKPVQSFQNTETIPSEEQDTFEDQLTRDDSICRDDSIITKDEPAPSSPGTRFPGLLRSKKSRSKSTLASEKEKPISLPPDTIDEEDTLRKDSESSSRPGRFSLPGFLKWGGKSNRNSGPSSFSNTSREEMQAAAIAQAQAQALAKLTGEDVPNASDSSTGHYLARKSSSSVPKRTRSRFREDLPEFPISPPASRVQSPEAEPPLPVLSENKQSELGMMRTSAMRFDTPTSGHRSIEAMRQTPTSMDRTYASPSPEPHMSMSLASIDSEGSWLSGGIKNRRSAMRDSLIRANHQEQHSSDESPTNSTQEDLAIADDEYLSRLTPRPIPGHNAMPRRSEEGRPSSDEEDLVDDSDLKWGAVGSRPHVVQRLTVKSYEGLLNIESENEDESESSPVSPSKHDEADVQRARSVHLGRGHVRNFSAGSAKLLDLTPRASVEDRIRQSSDRRSGSSLFSQ